MKLYKYLTFVLLAVAPAAAAVSTAISIATLKALTPTDSDVAIVAGYSGVNDGGGGTFTYSSTSTATDDGGLVIAPTSGTGRWFRTYSGPISALWFSGSDIGAKINNAIASISSSDGSGRIYVPRGSYNFSTPVNINCPGIILEGDGMATVLRWMSGSGTALLITSAGAQFHLQDFQLVSTGDGGGVGVSISSGIGYGSSIERVQLRNFSTQIVAGDGSGSVGGLTISGCRLDLYDGQTGIMCVVCNGCTIENTTIQGNLADTSTGIVLDACSGFTIRGGVIEHNAGGEVILQNATEMCLITGVYFETTKSTGIDVDVSSTSKGLTMVGNYHTGTNEYGYPDAMIKIRNGATDVAFFGNTWINAVNGVILNFSSGASRIHGYGNRTNANNFDLTSTGNTGLTGVSAFEDNGGIFHLTGDIRFRTGSGTPESNIPGVVGSVFLRSDGGSGTSLYVKESGAGTTGWVAK